MKIRNSEDWNKDRENNTDGYGKATLDYAERWADLMEVEIDGGAKLHDIAKRLSHEADSEGITGFMYGAAVSVLARVWEHGQELRTWHNLDIQIGDEGERANERGGTLNPALLNIESLE